MKIAIGADHGGVELKTAVIADLRRREIEVEDCGCYDRSSVDYPDYASAVATRVQCGDAEEGVLICTTGIGMSIAANKFAGIRAALCCTPRMADRARTHNNANILVLGAEEADLTVVRTILDTWLGVRFEGAPARHQRRVAKIHALECEHASDAFLAVQDREVTEASRGEERRERDTIDLIASENYVSRAVREAQGSVLTNKYAEGYPGRRWYNGCEFMDAVETLAISRAKALFGAEHVNVQPHCGSSANMAVYFAMLQPGDTILSMSLAHGGHLTHGHAINFSGRLFQVVPYGVSRLTEQIDYEEVARLAQAHHPKLIVAGASAYPRIIDFPRLRRIADECGAMLMADMAHLAGLVAAGCHPSPVPHCEFVTSTTHKTLRGPRGGMILCRERFAQEIDRQVFPGIQGGPLMHVIAAKAVCFREALQPEFRQYQAQIVRNAKVLAEYLAGQGMRIVSGGTDNHLMLADLTPLGVTGKDAAEALEKAAITVNKNAIPFDQQNPFVTSGIRIGTPAVTTRGMREAEMQRIGSWIVEVLQKRAEEGVLARIRGEVTDFCARFPLP